MSNGDMTLRDKIKEMCRGLTYMPRLGVHNIDGFKSQGFKDIDQLAERYGFKVFEMFVDSKGVDSIIFTYKGRTFLFKRQTGGLSWRSYPSF
ncbi:hypothetical protein V7094_28240 [Priestia megaterium]|uniref:hypothetical protein n=1 Tax=Priestia megaterium TaxID=1404 RepID=UPI002FFDB154